MDAHGGYLLQFEGLDVDLIHVAQQALSMDGGDPEDTSLLVSAVAARKVVRIAYDAPFTYGTKGARWYRTHHALPRLLSKLAQVAVHAYVFDPDEMEEVIAYREGRKVGGDSLLYDTVDFPEGGTKSDDEAYEKLQAEWPLGRLARIYGVSRAKLLGLPRSNGILVNLDGSHTGRGLEWAQPEGRIKAS